MRKSFKMALFVALSLLVNTIYGRWWHPLDEKPGPNPIPGSPLPWTGDFRDGLGNRLTMHAYANPPDIQNEKQRADGYGLARFNKRTRQITFECWPRFADARQGDQGQFPGWPITIEMSDNDGRQAVGYLPELVFEGANAANPVVQVIEDATGDILYTLRLSGTRFQPPVYSQGAHTVKVGPDKPDERTFKDLQPAAKGASPPLSVTL